MSKAKKPPTSVRATALDTIRRWATEELTDERENKPKDDETTCTLSHHQRRQMMELLAQPTTEPLIPPSWLLPPV